MTNILTKDEIKESIEACPDADLIQLIENGFVEYAKGNVVVPPVGHLPFSHPPGDLHIKYGYVKDDDFYVVKMASGFYDNPKLGLSSSNGLMLVFSQKTGELLSILLDEGYLTNVRTALAGAVVAKLLAPEKITTIGIVGTGIQARLQLRYLAEVVDVRKVMVWGRSEEKLDAYKNDSALKDFSIDTTLEIAELTEHCNFIVTTTPATKPLLLAHHIKPGTHITAMGADTPGKQEIDEAIFAKADIIVADSISQCVDHGELHYAVKNKIIDVKSVVALGSFIQNPKPRNAKSISVADLTGVAIQDIRIAQYVHQKYKSS